MMKEHGRKKIDRIDRNTMLRSSRKHNTHTRVQLAPRSNSKESSSRPSVTGESQLRVGASSQPSQTKSKAKKPVEAPRRGSAKGPVEATSTNQESGNSASRGDKSQESKWYGFEGRAG